MATVQSTSPVNDVASKVDAGRTRLAENFEMFLTLLTTQLRNQDPLAPMDGNQFTQQLVQMTSVEQQLLTNDLLEVIAGKDDDKFTQAVGLIGNGVTVESNEATLTGAGANWTYELPINADKVTLKITNAKGDVVFEKTDAGYTKGKHDVLWDGTITGGGTAPAGTYKLTVTATDSKGAAIASKTFTEGLVTGVEQKADDIYVSVGRSTYPMSKISSVWLAVASAPQPGDTGGSSGGGTGGTGDNDNTPETTTG
jgi:flagellar basal-body rod modification protein FlgD